MSHCIIAYDADNETEVDNVLFSSSNHLFCWFLYETLDAHECHNGNNGICIERIYTTNDLYTCRNRLLYYHDEYPKDIKNTIEKYIIEKDITIDTEEDSLLEDSSNIINIECESANVSFTVGYILKFLDKLIDMNCNIKINFT